MTTAALQPWHERSTDRLPDPVWHSTVSRVRGEFAEMPCMRVTPEQARILLGLDAPAAQWVLDTLTREGYLARTATGEYVKASATR
ncbi:MAG: hypothetical protein AB7K63_04130 [Vicinamibacterales bacterium]